MNCRASARTAGSELNSRIVSGLLSTATAEKNTAMPRCSSQPVRIDS